MTPGEILDRLANRLDLFKGGRDADPRQQTLRATIEWSHDLLDEEEQRLFARLSVFRGGCTLEARKDVLWDAIGLALDQEELGRAETLIEEFRELVERTGDARRLGYALGSSAVLAAKLGDFDGARAGFARARELATERGDSLRAGSMTVSLAAVSMASGDFRGGLDYAQDAVDRFRELGSERGLAIALLSSAWNAHGVGDEARAEGSCREAVSLAAEMSAVPLIAEAALVLGIIFVARQEKERGARLLAAAAAIRDELEITLNDAQEQKMHEAAVAAAKAALGEKAFAEAWARGEVMTPEDIVAICSEPAASESA
jgi:hypothetical protein